MLYVPFPSWTDEERLAHLPKVALERVRITPAAALRFEGAASVPVAFRLEMLGFVPVYRIVTEDKHVSLSATTGEAVGRISRGAARQHLEASFPADKPEFLAEIDYDQWTVTRRYDPHRPLLKFGLSDPAGTVVYVSSTTGEIVQNATSTERFWNWLGAIPHWLYFSPIRKDQNLWRQSVMWLSGPLVIGALTGLWIGLIRLRWRKRHAVGQVTPYRGWHKWHHLGGLAGGIFLTAWIASGWLSVNPFQLFARTQLTESQRAAFAGWRRDVFDDVDIAMIAQAGSGANDISFLSLTGVPLIRSHRDSGTALFDVRTGAQTSLDQAMLVEAARRVLPSAPVVDVEWLTEETLYWYSHRTKQQFPIIQVSFADPSATWLFLDPSTGEIADLKDRSARLYRWLFNFLHDYDLPILFRNQPARDVVVWLFSLAGLVVAVSGVVIGYLTLRRSL